MQNQIFFEDKIFIAGANGMVGASIFRKLKKVGYGSSKLGGVILTPNRKSLNLLNYENVNDWFKEFKPNVVVLAAAKVGGIYANNSKPADFLIENLKIQNNVIENAWKNGVRRLLFLGSSCIYPKFAQQPIKEEYFLKGELEKTNEPYAIAKIAGIKLCETLRKQYDFDAISIMPTNLYGPGDNYHPNNSHVMAALIRKFYEAVKNSQKEVICWGSGEPMREFLHVDDLGAAATFILEKWSPQFSYQNSDQISFLNVGTGYDIKIKDLAKKIAFFAGFKGEIKWDKTKPDGTPRKLLDIGRINALGWEPKIELDYGIKKTINDFSKIYEAINN